MKKNSYLVTAYRDAPRVSSETIRNKVCVKAQNKYVAKIIGKKKLGSGYDIDTLKVRKTSCKVSGKKHYPFSWKDKEEEAESERNYLESIIGGY